MIIGKIVSIVKRNRFLIKSYPLNVIYKSHRGDSQRLTTGMKLVKKKSLDKNNELKPINSSKICSFLVRAIE